MAIPSAPFNLIAKTDGSSTIHLTWTNPPGYSNPNIVPNSDILSVERKISGGAYAEISRSVGPVVEAFVDATCEDGTLYYYRIRVSVAGTWSPYSNIDSATTTLPAPTGLAGVANSTTKITLTWNDNSDNETGFLIYMKSGIEDYSLIHTTAANIKTYAKTGLVASMKYFFYVKATNASTTSTGSNVIALSTKNDETVNVTLYNTGHQDILIIDKEITISDVLTKTLEVVATDGAIHKFDTSHADNGYPVSSYIRTKDLDFTDQHPDIAGMLKTIGKFRLIYEDIDADTPITCYISNDGGINWSTSSATVGTGNSRVKTQDFYFMNSEYVTGLNHTFMLDCLSTTKTFLWLAFEIDFFVRGEHFNV